MPDHAVRVHQHEPDVEVRNCVTRRLRMLRVAEQCRGATVFQQCGQLIGVQRGVERDHRTSRRNDSQIRRDPAGMVIRHDGQPRSASESAFSDPSPHGFRHPVKLSIRAALDVIVALDFQRDVVRPALRAFDKPVVESGHESCGIYTKKLRCTTYCFVQFRRASFGTGQSSRSCIVAFRVYSTRLMPTFTDRFYQMRPERWPDKTSRWKSSATIASRVRMRELHRMAESVGRWIAENGFARGSRLAIVADNHPRWVAAYTSLRRDVRWSRLAAHADH